MVFLSNLNSKRPLIDEDVDMVMDEEGKKGRLNEGAEPMVNLYKVEAMKQPHLAL